MTQKNKIYRYLCKRCNRESLSVGETPPTMCIYSTCKNRKTQKIKILSEKYIGSVY